MTNNWDKCPLCGSKKINKKKKNIEMEIRDKKIKIPKVEYYECIECEEQFFDYEASKKIDEYCLKKGRMKV